MGSINPLVVVILVCGVVIAVLWLIGSLANRLSRREKPARTHDFPTYLAIAGKKYKISKTVYGTYSCQGKQFNSLKEATDFIENLWEPDMTGDPLGNDSNHVVKQVPPQLDETFANLPSRMKHTASMGLGIALLVVGFSIGATIDNRPGNIFAFLGAMLVVLVLIVPGIGFFLRGFGEWQFDAGNRKTKTIVLIIFLAMIVAFIVNWGQGHKW